MARRRGRIRIGCSGWEYAHWRGDFYPAALPRARWLEHYAAAFDTVEINASFYRLPAERTVRAWRDRAPDGFLFALKASRFLTHMKKLKDPAAPLDLFFSRARLLGGTLGPVLYQLPPRWARNDERLGIFLDTIPRDVPQAIEFRDPTWYARETVEALSARGVALCLHDMPGSTPARDAIGPFVYLRFHGAEAKYRGGYPRETLAGWAAWLDAQTRSGRDAYVYFNNDVGGHAPRDADALRELLAEGRI
jgi:uncharacterized protein YecE (DUF72 family)